MPVKIKSLSEVIQDTGLKILIHGPAGSGKTVLAATTNEPTLIISAESGLLSLNQNKDELISKGSPDFNPDYCSIVEVSTVEELYQVYEMLKNQSDYKWIILDSITEIAEVVLADELARHPDARKAYGELCNKMTMIMKKFRDLPYYHIVMTAKQQRITDELTGLTSYIPLMPGGKLGPAIGYIFDEVFCLRITKDEDGKLVYYIQAVCDGQYEAKDRSGKLSAYEKPSLKAIYEKIYDQK
jgi:hypothetical protein